MNIKCSRVAAFCIYLCAKFQLTIESYILGTQPRLRGERAILSYFLLAKTRRVFSARAREQNFERSLV